MFSSLVCEGVGAQSKVDFKFILCMRRIKELAHPKVAFDVAQRRKRDTFELVVVRDLSRPRLEVRFAIIAEGQGRCAAQGFRVVQSALGDR